MILSEKIKKAISAFTELPGIGPRHATRLVFFLVSSLAFFPRFIVLKTGLFLLDFDALFLDSSLGDFP